MPDAFMPDVQVDIAFNAGYTTPAASRTWTDVSQYVELAQRIQIAFGRQDERSTADANTLTLTLDNSDGRFTAGRAASPYSPNVKIGRPIRVRVTPVGGSTVTRFVGFIDEWPVEWDGSDRYAKAQIRATSRMSRLGLSTKMRSIPEQAILAASPIGYWTLGDPSGSKSAAESSASGIAGPLTEATAPGVVTPTFGSAIGSPVDDLTGLTFAALPSSAFEAQLAGSTVRSVRVCFIADAGSGSTRLIQVFGSDRLEVVAQGSAGYGITVSNLAGALASGGSAAPDQLHDLVVTTSSAAGTKVYLDGSLVASGTGFDFVSAAAFRLGPLSTLTNRTFSYFHAAAYDTVLTASQVADQATAMFTGFSGERTDQRLARILGWAGVASSEIATETGVDLIMYQKTSGQSYVDALRDVESTEGGVLYDRTDGSVGFHSRPHRYLSTTAATLNMASQHVGADYSPKLDRSTLVNDVTVSNSIAEQSARVMSAASVDEYGVATASTSVTATTYEALQQRANWLIASYAVPATRVPSLTVDILAHQGLTPSAQTLLAVTLGDVLAVTNAPMQADTTSPKYYVEGYTESIGPESYGISFNLSPAYPNLNTFLLDDATRGVLDAGNVIAL